MKKIICLVVLSLSLKFYSQDRITGELFSTRSEIIAENGMVATSHPLATQIGIDISFFSWEIKLKANSGLKIPDISFIHKELQSRSSISLAKSTQVSIVWTGLIV